MKFLWKLLVFLKFVMLPPLVAFFVWIIEVIISSFVRFIPTLLDKILFFCENNLGQANIISQCLWGIGYIAQFIGRVVYGLNGWFPVSFLLSAWLFCLSFRTKWFVTRFFIKAFTLGKL